MNDLCLRDPQKTRQEQQRLKGLFTVKIYWNGAVPRGTDRPERAYVAVEAYRTMGISIKEACLRVADLQLSQLGKSSRGRKTTSSKQRDGASIAETIRSRKEQVPRALAGEFARKPYSGISARARLDFESARKRDTNLHLDRVQKDPGRERAYRQADLIREIKETYSNTVYTRANAGYLAGRELRRMGSPWDGNDSGAV